MLFETRPVAQVA